MTKAFQNQKAQALCGVDLSRKGSIDQPILELVKSINEQEHYFTLSSCSGRICLFEHVEEAGDAAVHKKGCVWLYTTHGECNPHDVLEALAKSKGDAALKFEAFVMHIQCCTVEDAQGLHAEAVAAGFRNSGITLGKKGKIVLGVRSTHGLEVPCTHTGHLMVDEQYIQHVCRLANEKMAENKKRHEKFYIAVKDYFKQREQLNSKSTTKKYPKQSGVKAPVKGTSHESRSPVNSDTHSAQQIAAQTQLGEDSMDNFNGDILLDSFADLFKDTS